MHGLLVLATFLTTALAAPTLSWTPALGSFYAAVDAHIQSARRDGLVTPPTCDLSKAKQPVAPTPLPSPDPSWVLSEVVVGRGVQNYTCALASKDVKPVAIGAVASLYNVSCLAANYPDILSMIPPLALEYALPADPSAALAPSNLELVGHHYFSGNGTPTFDLTTVQSSSLGVGAFRKDTNSTAPSDAFKGQNGVGNGAVAWLRLNATFGTTEDLKAVYRLNTAGGNPPATCESSPAVFSVQYAAEYWFYTVPGTKLL